jgi:hypothetical protein
MCFAIVSNVAGKRPEALAKPRGEAGGQTAQPLHSPASRMSARKKPKSVRTTVVIAHRFKVVLGKGFKAAVPAGFGKTSADVSVDA